jgi:hypothetical protein
VGAIERRVHRAESGVGVAADPVRCIHHATQAGREQIGRIECLRAPPESQKQRNEIALIRLERQRDPRAIVGWKFCHPTHPLSHPNYGGDSVRSVLAASDRTTEAEALLKRTVEETKRTGFGALACKAWLALGETEIKSLNSATGRAELKTLEHDAKEKGLLLIASEAY